MSVENETVPLRRHRMDLYMTQQNYSTTLALAAAEKGPRLADGAGLVGCLLRPDGVTGLSVDRPNPPPVRARSTAAAVVVWAAILARLIEDPWRPRVVGFSTKAVRA